jgi:hypothetical protein
MKNITTWIERKIWQLIVGYKNYRQNTSWVYHGIGGIGVLLYMLSSEAKLEWVQLGLRVPWAFARFKVHPQITFWGIALGYD